MSKFRHSGVLAAREHLLAGEPITRLEAIILFGVPDLTKLISELHPAPYNPRVQLEPGDARYRKLKHSIERFGLVEPLLWNAQTNTLGS